MEIASDDVDEALVNAPREEVDVDVDLVAALLELSMLMSMVFGSKKLKFLTRTPPAIMSPHNRLSNIVMRGARSVVAQHGTPESGDGAALAMYLKAEGVAITDIPKLKKGSLEMLYKACYEKNTHQPPG